MVYYQIKKTNFSWISNYYPFVVFVDNYLLKLTLIKKVIKIIKADFSELRKYNHSKEGIGIVLALGIIIPETSLNKHTLLIGATGSGKTATMINIIKQLRFKFRQKIIIIDGKGDYNLFTNLTKISQQCFFWSIDGHQKYNPFLNQNNVINADKIMSLFDFSEPHYQSLAHNYLLILLKYFREHKIKTTLDNIVHYFPKKMLLTLITKNNDDYHKIASFTPRDINSLYHRLNLYAEQLTTSIGQKNTLAQLVKRYDIILFSLNSLQYPQLASNFGKLLIQDLKNYSVVKNHDLKINIFLDEFDVFANKEIVNLINKTRSFNYQIFLGFQTINDLQTGGYNLTDSIFGNVSNLIIHRLADPNSSEYLAKILGTQNIETTSKQILLPSTGVQSIIINQKEEFLFHPNELKNLKVGEAVVRIFNENTISFDNENTFLIKKVFITGDEKK